MHNFQYYTPTKVVFGKDTEKQTGSLVKEQGGKKVLIHYGGGSVIRSGLLDRVKASLAAEHMDFVELGGAVPNPRLGLVYEGIELCKKEGVDFILAVGGGSAIDSAKAIGYGAVNEGDVWDFYDYKRQPSHCLPIGVVLTIAATGSEMSDSSVITKEDGWIKRGYSNDLSRPRFAVMNPDLTKTLPDYQTACGCTDILMHTMERYFTNGGNMEITDSMAEALMRTVIKNAKILAEGEKLRAQEWFYYGRELFAHEKQEQAAEVLRAFLENPEGGAENKAEAVRMLGHCLQVAGKEEEGISLLLEGLQFAPPTGEHCCEIGEYFYEKGQWEQAIFWYENALHAERCTEQGAFVQEECYGFLPCIRLCVCYGRLGEWEMAKMYNEMAGVFRPEDASVRQNREYLAKRA